jgi:hypothetical protein
LSEQSFFLAVETSIGTFGLPLSSWIEDLFFLSVKLAIFELTTAPVAKMFH